MPNVRVREIQHSDLPLLKSYWTNSSDDHLTGMGVDLAKLGKLEGFEEMLRHQIEADYPEKQNYCLIWLLDKLPIGHCNINQIEYGSRANMHLHIWETGHRQKGMGAQLVRASIPFFFKHFSLQELLCEPYALNPAPNKTIPKLGFKWVKRYTTTPGSINFEQEVNQYRMDLATFQQLYQ